jgi:hypothetical protein
VVGDGDEEGIDCATARKKSNMNWREAGSYLDRYLMLAQVTIRGRFKRVKDVQGFTYIDRIDVTFMEGSDMPIRKKTIGEQRQQDKFRQSE